jgi:hypothetical protein
MKKNYLIAAGFVSFCLLLSFSSSLKAQMAFNKGSLLVSISEGSTMSNYSTTDISNPEHPVLKHRCESDGTRDPITIEYGISQHWSLGFTSGKDIFTIDPSAYYGFKRADNSMIKVSTSDFTFNGAYHFFVNRRLDLSAFGSLGMFGVSFKGKESSDAASYIYSSKGNMVRGGLQVRYYFLRHFGAFGMISSYWGNSSPKDVKGNTVGTNYSTKIGGSAIEAGLCYRFIK